MRGMLHPTPPFTHFHSPNSLPRSLLTMESSGFKSAHSYEIDPTSGQIFYREPIESLYQPGCATLEPLNHHPLRLAGHNVGDRFKIIFLR